MTQPARRLLAASADLVGPWLLASGFARLLGDPRRGLADAARARSRGPWSTPLFARLPVEREGSRFDAHREHRRD